MFKKRNACRLFFAFLFLSSLLLWNTCTKKNSPTEPGDDVTHKETPAMAAFSDSLIIAFQSGNVEDVLALTNPEYRSVCEEELEGTQTTMTAVGQALKKRKIVSASTLYAEYQITINGTTFSIACGNCGDDRWQLIRF